MGEIFLFTQKVTIRSQIRRSGFIVTKSLVCNGLGLGKKWLLIFHRFFKLTMFRVLPKSEGAVDVVAEMGENLVAHQAADMETGTSKDTRLSRETLEKIFLEQEK